MQSSLHYTTSMGMPDAFYITYAKLRLNFSMVTVVFINTYTVHAAHT